MDGVLTLECTCGPKWSTGSYIEWDESASYIVRVSKKAQTSDKDGPVAIAALVDLLVGKTAVRLPVLGTTSKYHGPIVADSIHVE